MQRRSPKERPHLPPAPLLFAHPLRIPGGAVAGAAVLEEVQADRAVLAFMALRAAHALAAGADAARTLLPAGGADRREEERVARARAGADAAPADEPPLLPALAALVAALRLPEETTAEETGWACLRVTEWALGHGAPETALAFAQAAALARPDSSGLAWKAGKMLRNHGRMREAEWWLKRAVRVAVWTDDDEMVATGLSSLGNLHYMRGEFRQAKATYLRALRLARRCHLGSLEGEVLHDLCVAAMMMGETRSSEEFARRALDLYGPRHPKLPKLAHDVAQLWMAQGYFARSLPVLHALLGHFDHSEDRLRVVASAARAAGACGDEGLFELLWAEAWTLVGGFDGHAVIAAALTDLGIGASSLRLWKRAAEALRRASDLAARRGETDVEERAEHALRAVLAQQAADHHGLRDTLPRGSSSAALAADLLQSLRLRLACGPAEGSLPA